MTRTAMSTVANRKSAKGQKVSTGEDLFDRELEVLPQELRWREWMGRIEAVLFASASPVERDDLARVVGQGASVEMLIDDIQAELAGRPYELSQVAGGWMFRTKTQFAEAIKAAADLGDQPLVFTEMEMGCSAPSPITSPSTGRG
ncbi:Putative transcriptional regulators (Ypuh-like) [Thalassobacter stenotrophicus]|uniref:Transcriptional regulators (Ypuh-like) n=2 Tax=Thalassobacter stenotrophicus TaxID=266809 RepID=A0ABY1ILF9_9RHOB|nr:Putative transcriptional regulators (Ypuh-like) [Thalassobacter stenotrophicus]SHJ38389.1 Putative transcriptional regulators (Ypuh-like) [Thalassobacter stenotrophicus DSM 16310]